MLLGRERGILGLHAGGRMPKLSLQQAAWILRGSIAFIWLYTALVSMVLSPAQGLELLAATGITGPFATALMYGTSLFEVLLGVLVLWGRFTRPLALLQAAMIVGF